MLEQATAFKTRIAWSAVVLAFLALFAGAAYAQLSTASVNGTIRDSSGAIVPEAAVSVRNSDTGVLRSARSNASGNYVLVDIPPGNYTIEVEKSGFRRVQVQPFTLMVNQTATFDLTLQVGGVEQSITVEAVGVEVQSSSAELGGVVGKQEIVDLPLNGRNFLQLLRLVPGASPINVTQAGTTSQGVGAATYPSFNGQGNRSNMFLTDGVNNLGAFSSIPAVPPIVDSIQEFKVQSHNDQAEFGMATGGVVNVVTKSGTNEFHGSVWEFLRNDVFDARNPFRADVTPLRQNMFGGTLGGPILRNRTFFYAGYQGYRKGTPANSLYRVPTPENLRGDMSDWPRQIFDPLTTRQDPARPGVMTRSPFTNNQIPVSRFDQGFLAYLRATVPAPIVTGVADRNQLDDTATTQRQEEYTVRVDHTFGARDFVWARVSGNYFDQEGSGGRQGFLTSTEYPPISIGASWVHTFGASSVLQAQFGRSRHHRDLVSSFADGKSAAIRQETGFNQDFCCAFRSGDQLVPGVNVAQFFSGGERAEHNTFSDIYQYKANYTLLKGTHQFKWGGEFNQIAVRLISNDHNIAFDTVGTADPQNAARTGSPLASFLLNVPLSADRRDFYKTSRPGGVMGFYFQDTWKALPRLTVNAGLRYDRTFVPPIGDRGLGTIYMGNLDMIRGIYTLQAKPDTCAVLGKAPCIPDPTGKLPDHVDVDPRGRLLHDSTDNWQPRFGIAYRISDKMALRGSFGMFFDNFAGVVQSSQNLGHTWPDVGRRLSGNLNTPTPAQPLPTVSGKDPFPQALVPAANPFADGAFFMDPYFKNSYSMQWNFGIQRQLNQDTLFGLNYVGSGNRRLSIGGFYNVATTPGPGSIAARQPFTYITPGNFSRSWGKANYNALQAQVNKRFSQGLSFMVAYTWSKSINTACDAFFAESCSMQNPYDFNKERSIASTDLPHILSVTWLYDLPIGAGKALKTGNRTADYIIGGWQVNGIASFHSGRPFTVNVNGDIANTGNQSGYMRPNVLRDPTLSTPSVSRWFDTSAFAAPATFTFGNAGRNILRAHGASNFDLSLFRRFPLPFREGMGLEFRVESFNALNRTNYGTPVSNFSSVTFGAVTSASGERQLQMGLKLNF